MSRTFEEYAPISGLVHLDLERVELDMLIFGNHQFMITKRLPGKSFFETSWLGMRDERFDASAILAPTSANDCANHGFDNRRTLPQILSLKHENSRADARLFSWLGIVDVFQEENQTEFISTIQITCSKGNYDLVERNEHTKNSDGNRRYK